MKPDLNPKSKDDKGIKITERMILDASNCE
jgi:hypothetical protein